MAPRSSSSAERFIVDEPATLAEVKELFGIDDERAARLTRWVQEARAANSHRTAESPAKPAARRNAKKTRSKPASRR